jgi:hypothetical protein
MKAALAEHPATTFEVPSGISFTTVDPHSGELRSTRREIAGWVPVAEGRDTRYAEFVPPPELEVVIEADSRGVLLPAPGGEPTAWPPPGPRPHLDAVR